MDERWVVALLLILPASSGAQSTAPDILWTSDGSLEGWDGDVHAGRAVFITRGIDEWSIQALDIWNASLSTLHTSATELGEVRSDGRDTVFTQRINGTRTLMWLRDGEAKPLAPSGARQDQPALYDGHVAWADSRSGSSNIFLAPLQEGPIVTRLAPHEAGQFGPALSARYVAWSDERSATPLISLPLPGRATHPNNIDVYGYDRESGESLPMVEALNRQDHVAFLENNDLVFRSQEAAGRQIFLQDLGSQAGPQPQLIDPDTTAVRLISTMGDRIVYMDGNSASSDVIVWRGQRLGSTGPFEAATDLRAHGGLALVERVTREGERVVDILRLPTDLRPVVERVEHRSGEICVQVRVDPPSPEAEVWLHTPRGQRTVQPAAAGTVDLCAPPGSMLRAVGPHEVSGLVPMEAVADRDSPASLLLVMAALALGCWRRRQ